jgi:phosphoribosylformimino-5-aminoimidazole carboxamide ribonucleotide (ProFAR) isomerase
MLKKDSPAVLQQFREEYLEVYKSVDPTGAHYTRNSDVFEAIHKACTDWIRMDGILSKLSNHAFRKPGSSRFVTSTRLLMALQQGVWSSNYVRDAEKFTSQSTQ